MCVVERFLCRPRCVTGLDSGFRHLTIRPRAGGAAGPRLGTTMFVWTDCAPCVCATCYEYHHIEMYLGLYFAFEAIEQCDVPSTAPC